jgi:MFS transporter, ACS family, D-galactonate transporter
MASIAKPMTNGVSRALVLLIGASVLLNLADRGTIAIAAPLMKSELGLTATAFGTAVSAFFWIYAPVQFFVGWLCDRFSVYRLMALGVLIWAAGTFLMGFAGGFVSLLVLRVMLGVGESFAFPGSSKIIARHVPAESRGIANSAIAIGIALGPAVGTLAGGLLVASLGWRAMFMAFGFVTLIWLLPWQQVTGSLPSRPEDHAELAVPSRKLLGNFSLWATGIGHAANNYGFYFVLTWLPLYLVQQRGLSIERMTIVATLAYAVQAVSALAVGHLSDRWTRVGRSEASIRRAMLSIGQLTVAVCTLGIAASSSILVVAVLLCITCAAHATGTVNHFCVAQMFAGPRAAGNWVGVQNALANIAGILGPIISGILIDRAGFGSAFILAAAIAAFAAFWWGLVLPPIRQIDFDQ